MTSSNAPGSFPFAIEGQPAAGRQTRNELLKALGGEGSFKEPPGNVSTASHAQQERVGSDSIAGHLLGAVLAVVQEEGTFVEGEQSI